MSLAMVAISKRTPPLICGTEIAISVTLNLVTACISDNTHCTICGLLAICDTVGVTMYM